MTPKKRQGEGNSKRTTVRKPTQMIKLSDLVVEKSITTEQRSRAFSSLLGGICNEPNEFNNDKIVQSVRKMTADEIQTSSATSDLDLSDGLQVQKKDTT